ncbi:hypothetical protein MTR_2g099080 [Medicago truncatula]|uniref:Uncharacterized protein n=1 Tax=Medicago truncatula TaxID=3880 RepID=G7IS03_MEDTR|nr:hypothetical protein MTR_2g099080 [Medicago truncatula]
MIIGQSYASISVTPTYHLRPNEVVICFTYSIEMAKPSSFDMVDLFMNVFP